MRFCPPISNATGCAKSARLQLVGLIGDARQRHDNLDPTPRFVQMPPPLPEAPRGDD